MNDNVKTLPADPPESAPNDSPPLPLCPSSARTPDQARTLLVAEEDWVFREYQTRILTDGGYYVLKAAGAAEAMVLARATPFINLLLTDYSMVGLDGLELTRQFRAIHPQTPVLMFTGSLPVPGHRMKNLERFAILGKPFDVKKLLHKIRLLLDAVVPLPRQESSASN